MKKQQYKNGRRLRLVPLVVGGYGIFLGLGLTAVGFSQITGGIGIIRALLGLAMIGFGIWGVWDGVRDLIAPEKKPEKSPTRQFILTDVDGKRSSNVTVEILRAQLDLLAERSIGDGFHLQILPPVFDQEKGELKLISCILQDKITVIAFFKHSEEEVQVWRKESDRTEDVLRQILEGRLDFSEWEKCTTAVHNEDHADRPRQCLRLFGESWENHLQFFSPKDVELGVKGIAEGKYRRIELELGAAAFSISLSEKDKSVLALRMGIWSEAEGRFHIFEKTGTAVQVNFWLVQMINGDLPTELHGWKDISTRKK